MSRGKRLYLVLDGEPVYSGRQLAKTLRLRDRFWPGAALESEDGTPVALVTLDGPVEDVRNAETRKGGERGGEESETVILVCAECRQKFEVLRWQYEIDLEEEGSGYPFCCASCSGVEEVGG